MGRKFDAFLAVVGTGCTFFVGAYGAGLFNDQNNKMKEIDLFIKQTQASDTLRKHEADAKIVMETMAANINKINDDATYSRIKTSQKLQETHDEQYYLNLFDKRANEPEYILSKLDIYDSFAEKMIEEDLKCCIIEGSSGIGKSTFLQLLQQEYRKKEYPVIFVSITEDKKLEDLLLEQVGIKSLGRLRNIQNYLDIKDNGKKNIILIIDNIQILLQNKDQAKKEFSSIKAFLDSGGRVILASSRGSTWMKIKALSGSWNCRLNLQELPSITDEELANYLKRFCPSETDDNIQFFVDNIGLNFQEIENLVKSKSKIKGNHIFNFSLC